MKRNRLKSSKKIILTLASLSFFFLSGCGQENLYQDLSEADANEILVVLYKQGVDASKVRIEAGQDVSYSVQVPKEDVQQAQQILIANNLPRKKELGFSGICKEERMIPTPQQEKCRRLLALKGEIINSLEMLDQVVDADVVLNIPEVDPFASDDQDPKQPTASAVIRLRNEASSTDMDTLRESHLQRFISNSVEGLDPRNVALIVSYTKPLEKVPLQGSPDKPEAGSPTGGSSASGGTAVPSAGPVTGSKQAVLSTIVGLQMHEGSVQRFKIYAMAMLGLLILVSALLIFNVFRLTRLKQQLKAAASATVVEPEDTPALPEAGEPAQLPAAEEAVEAPPEEPPQV